ncbi:MAG: glutamate 5-kinase [Clostridiales bacterium]
MEELRKKLKKLNRIVVKVGTSTITHENGKINFERLDRLTRALSGLANQGKDVVLVTSGAIGVGLGKLNLSEKPRTTGEKQALAAIGQCELMHIYSRFFSEYSYFVGQMLVTRNVFINDGSGRENIINTFNNLFDKRIIPIVNENDSVSVDEIDFGTTHIFGDNDTLSVYVAKAINADILILLSDIDGFFDCDPKIDGNAKLISVIHEITDNFMKYAGNPGSKRGTGGMATKIEAAKIAIESNIIMAIANGKDPLIINDILNGKDLGSLFVNKKILGKPKK